MKTIQRKVDRYKPKRSIYNDINYLESTNLINLIKLADEWCLKYGYEYDEPIYKVVVVDTKGQMLNTSYNPANTKNSKYSGTTSKLKFYYEVKLRKVVVA